MTLSERWERHRKQVELDAKVDNNERIIRLCKQAFLAGATQAVDVLYDEITSMYKELDSPVVIDKGKL